MRENVVTTDDGKEILAPTVHLNGTSRKELLRTNREALDALERAVDLLVEAGPNGRDFYVQGADAIRRALAEHSARLSALVAAKQELQAIVESLEE